MEPLNPFVSRYPGSAEWLAPVFLPSKAAVIANVLAVVIITASKTILISNNQMVKDKRKR